MANPQQVSVPRRDWVLLLLAVRDAGEPLDPVRIQSGMFMLSHDLSSQQAPLYDFELVDSAPFSPTVTSDLVELEEAGFVSLHDVAGYTWSEFTATSAGIDHASSIVTAMSEPELDALRRLAEAKQSVLRLGFRDLIDHLEALILYPHADPF